jgi:hypothetical protein
VFIHHRLGNFPLYKRQNEQIHFLCDVNKLFNIGMLKNLNSILFNSK